MDDQPKPLDENSRKRSLSDVGVNINPNKETPKRAFRIYWANDNHMYWTLLLDSTNTVGDVSEGLKDKVPSSGVQCYLYKRTKANFGRWKDRRLSNEDSVWDIVDRRRKNHKSDPIFVLKRKKSTFSISQKKSPQIESDTSPLSSSGEILNPNYNSSSNNNGSVHIHGHHRSTSGNNSYISQPPPIPPPPPPIRDYLNNNNNNNNNNNVNSNNNNNANNNNLLNNNSFISPMSSSLVSLSLSSSSSSHSPLSSSIPTSPNNITPINTSPVSSQRNSRTLKSTMEMEPPPTHLTSTTTTTTTTTDSSPNKSTNTGRPLSGSFIPGSIANGSRSSNSDLIGFKPVSNSNINNNNNNSNSSTAEPIQQKSSPSAETATQNQHPSTQPIQVSPLLPSHQPVQQQQPTNNKPLSGSTGMNRSSSPSPFAKKNNGSLLERKNRLSGQPKDIMRLMRFYFGDSLDGTFFTIAVQNDTTAKDVCLSVEQKLLLPSHTTFVSLVLPFQPNGSKIERVLGDEEIIIEVKDTWEDPSQTFFQVTHKQQAATNKRLSRQIPQNEPHVIPSEWRRSTDAVTLRASSDDMWKRKSIPIFLQVTGPPNGSGGHSPQRHIQNSPHTMSSSPHNNPTPPFHSHQHQQQLMNHPLDHLQQHHQMVDDESSDDESDFDVSTLRGWVHWIPSADLEYIKRIGSGTYSKVYKGKYRDKFVAIKTMRGSNMTTEQIESFKKECDILSTIQSPFLISFYGSCIEENQLSMVVEYCSKGTLHKVLNNNLLDFDWDKWFKWMIEVVEGVKYLHNMNPPMVHRDLKTLNILISSDWSAKLCDFGLTRTMTMTNVSTLGMLRGTMAYTAPEIYDGLLFNTKSDVYSLAVIMWEAVQRCITGSYLRPFHEHPISMDIQIIILTSKNKVRPKINDLCPEELKTLITRCWDENPDQRPNCEEILDTLLKLKVSHEENKDNWESIRTKTPKQTIKAISSQSSSASSSSTSSSNSTTITTTSTTSTSTSNCNNNNLNNNSHHNIINNSISNNSNNNNIINNNSNNNSNHISDNNLVNNNNINNNQLLDSPVLSPLNNNVPTISSVKSDSAISSVVNVPTVLGRDRKNSITIAETIVKPIEAPDGSALVTEVFDFEVPQSPPLESVSNNNLNSNSILIKPLEIVETNIDKSFIEINNNLNNLNIKDNDNNLQSEINNNNNKSNNEHINNNENINNSNNNEITSENSIGEQDIKSNNCINNCINTESNDSSNNSDNNNSDNSNNNCIKSIDPIILKCEDD